MSIWTRTGAWAALAALLLGGCWLETGEPIDDHEDALLDDELAEVILGEDDPGAGRDRGTGGSGSDVTRRTSVETAGFDWELDRRADPHPDPWKRTDLHPRSGSLDH